MSEWAARRFWTRARVAEVPGGHEVRLDDRALRTPLRSPLVLPTVAMAEAVAAEWDAAGERIDPLAMPVTRSANSAVDKVAPQREEVIGLLAEYGATDLLCYRADGPAPLIERQMAAWDPLLAWAEDAHDARLRCAVDVMPIAQDATAMARLRAPLEAADSFALTAFHDLVSISGSLVIALAVAQGALRVEAGWDASALDEAWQREILGRRRGGRGLCSAPPGRLPPCRAIPGAVPRRCDVIAVLPARCASGRANGSGGPHRAPLS